MHMFRRWRALTFTLLYLAFAVAFFHRVAPTVIASDMAESLGASAFAIGSIGAMYYYAYSLMQIPSGILADRIGPRLSVGGSMILGGLGSIVFALSPDVFTANLGRLIIGLGVAFAFVGTMRAAASWFDPRAYAMATSWIILAGNAGAVLAGSPLAWLLNYVSWRSVFFGIGLFSVALALAVLWLVRDTPARAGFASSPGIGPTGTGGAIWPRLKDALRQRNIWLSLLAGGGIMGGYFGFTGVWAVPYMEVRSGLSQQQAADILTVSLFALAAGVPVCGWLADRVIGRKPLIVICAAACAVIWLVLAAWPSPGYWMMLLLLCAYGIAGGAMVAIFAITKEQSPPAAVGFSIAVVNTGLFGAAAVLQLVLGWVLSLTTSPAYPQGNFVAAVALLLGGSTIGLIAGLMLKENPQHAVE
jgi:MFS family permease